MDEIIKLVVKKTGISEEQARQAVKTVVDFIKDKLPGPLGDQIDNALKGGNPQDLFSNLGGLLGDKKQ